MSEHTVLLGHLIITHGGPVASESVSSVPQAISRAQGKIALIRSGVWDSVLAFVAAIPDPAERAEAEVALHDTQVWQRTSPFLNIAAAALGLSSEEMDALFVSAASVQI